jgi:hypothetical protein
MRASFAALCIALLFDAAVVRADDVRMLNVGLRVGAAGPNVLGGDEDESFQQYDVFATAALPWGWYHESGWGVRWRLQASAGVLAGGGDSGFIGTLVPLLAIGPREGQLSLDGGFGAAILARHEFGEQDFGGPFQVVATFGLRVPVYRRFAIGYRMQHVSDARIYGDEGNGADLHMLELSYGLRPRLASPRRASGAAAISAARVGAAAISSRRRAHSCVGRTPAGSAGVMPSPSISSPQSGQAPFAMRFETTVNP